jgi:two-component system sensor histidine kinase YesM
MMVREKKKRLFRRGMRREDLADNPSQQIHDMLMEKQAELDALQSQMNPHFLYNTLDSIRSLALSSGADEIADMLESLAKFYRYSISRHENVVLLGEEIENAKNYFKIQQFRFNNRFALNLEIADSESYMQCKIPKMTLQPIIENAIFYGLEPKMGNGHVTIKVVDTGYQYLIIISDDGVGIDDERLAVLRASIKDERTDSNLYAQEKTKSRNGLALPNIQKRLRLNFGDAYGLAVSSTKTLGTDVEIRLPKELS